MMFVTTESEMKIIHKKPAGADEWVAEAGKRRITGNRLRPTAEAKTVHVRDSKIVVTDGPFAESKEVIVGFDILDCDSLEEAITIAAKHPLATTGRLEVRAFWPFDE
ncbi:YciI family protein [Hyphomicrobium sp.]|uniref:YciI family protein n=1 Tax=Hyphomicrobium sp. TaxID=82 RepID=UPI002E300FD8|nr:YciI family protein [Hyphomicrobium sp.]HEX2840665.1 YciI family protein [Hyphomicrobium sp.]